MNYIWLIIKIKKIANFTFAFFANNEKWKVNFKIRAMVAQVKFWSKISKEKFNFISFNYK